MRQLPQAAGITAAPGLMRRSVPGRPNGRSLAATGLRGLQQVIRRNQRAAKTRYVRAVRGVRRG